jgi:hypothetical protein
VSQGLDRAPSLSEVTLESPFLPSSDMEAGGSEE